jgi:hypothetical protein
VLVIAGVWACVAHLPPLSLVIPHVSEARSRVAFAERPSDWRGGPGTRPMTAVLVAHHPALFMCQMPLVGEAMVVCCAPLGEWS